MSYLVRIVRLGIPNYGKISKKLQDAILFNNFAAIRTISTASNKVSHWDYSFTPLISSSTQWKWQKWEPIELPVKPVAPFQLPEIVRKDLSIEIPLISEKNKIISEPTSNIVKKEAARLIVIRRKKMKKHKLRKLRKRMKYEWAKIRQRRELKKEKEFQAGLIAQCKSAEAFDAKEYVAENIRKATEVPIPRFWKGKRLPEFIIRQKLGLPPKV